MENYTKCHFQLNCKVVTASIDQQIVSVKLHLKIACPIVQTAGQNENIFSRVRQGQKQSLIWMGDHRDFYVCRIIIIIIMNLKCFLINNKNGFYPMLVKTEQTLVQSFPNCSCWGHAFQTCIILQCSHSVLLTNQRLN